MTPTLFTELVDPALVMNTETAALTHYTNFGFESLAQLPDGRVLAAGPAGLALLGGPDDMGDLIPASVTTGLLDFGNAQTKRVEATYFGYTSDGQMDLEVDAWGSTLQSATYTLEQRLLEAPINTRVQLGKGLFGRYWRLTLKNVAGAAFEIHDMSADVATSARRV